MVGNVPITRYWLIPIEVRPKMFTPHPSMSSDEIRQRTQRVGQVLQLERDLAALWLHAESAFQDCVHLPLETVPADVRGHRNLNRQSAQEKGEELGAVDS